MTTTNEQAQNSTRSSGNSVIVNVIDVLRCFTVQNPTAGVTEIADQVGLHKSSISRILATLEAERVVERDEQTRKFRLGTGLIAIAGPLLANLDVRRIAYPLLKELAQETGETAVLNIWDGAESVSVEQIASPHHVKHTSAMGSRYRTGMSATIQMFLAHEPVEVARELLTSSRIELDGPLNIAEYLELLDKTRARGYAVNYGQTSKDEVGVAAPVFDHRGAVVACVMIAAPYYRVSLEVLDSLVQQCVQSARRISVRMGYQADQD